MVALLLSPSVSSTALCTPFSLRRFFCGLVGTNSLACTWSLSRLLPRESAPGELLPDTLAQEPGTKVGAFALRRLRTGLAAPEPAEPNAPSSDDGTNAGAREESLGEDEPSQDILRRPTKSACAGRTQL